VKIFAELAYLGFKFGSKMWLCNFSENLLCCKVLMEHILFGKNLILHLLQVYWYFIELKF